MYEKVLECIDSYGCYDGETLYYLDLKNEEINSVYYNNNNEFPQFIDEEYPYDAVIKAGKEASGDPKKFFDLIANIDERKVMINDVCDVNSAVNYVMFLRGKWKAADAGVLNLDERFTDEEKMEYMVTFAKMWGKR